MIRSLILALGQLGDPSIQRLAIRCVVVALGLFVALLVAVGTGLALVDLTGIQLLDTAITVLGSGLTLVVAWLLFPATLLLIVGLFVDEVVDAVERRHYPGLPPGRDQPFLEGLGTSARTALIAIGLNLLLLPVYLVPVLSAPVFLALNGYLVGREYFEAVAQRRLGPKAAAAERRRVGTRVWVAGAIIAMMMTLPLFNLLAPIVGTAFMVHEFQRHGAAGRRAVGGVA